MNIHLYFLQRILNLGLFRNNLIIKELLQNSTKNYICLDPKPPIVNILTHLFSLSFQFIYACMCVCVCIHTDVLELYFMNHLRIICKLKYPLPLNSSMFIS